MKRIVIVPDGVLFGSSNAHKSLRKMLIDDCELQGAVSMPSGVFKPYAGVSTAILVFVKGGTTECVWFYDMQADGYSLDDKRDRIEANDLPDIVVKWKCRGTMHRAQETSRPHVIPDEDPGSRKGHPHVIPGEDPGSSNVRTDVIPDSDRESRKNKHFFVPVNEIIENNYDLSINRYKEIDYTPPEYDKPEVILEKIEGLEKEISKEIARLREFKL